MTFESAVKSFLDSVVNQDWDCFISFLDEELPLNILLPNRRPITNYVDFIHSQKDFFENENAHFKYKIIELKEMTDHGFAVVHSKVKLNPNEDTVIELQICFLFQKRQNSWKLIFDQNSLLPRD